MQHFMSELPEHRLDVTVPLQQPAEMDTHTPFWAAGRERERGREDVKWGGVWRESMRGVKRT